MKPPDIPLLEIEIAKKTKAFNNCDVFPERDILGVELDTLKRVQAMLNMAIEPPSIDPAESARKDMKK